MTTQTTSRWEFTNQQCLAIIFLEGFITISAEILTIRQLIPVMGNSVVVTSLIIGVFLLFLAYGYKRGGRYTDNFSAILKRNFKIATFLFGVGLSYSFVLLFFYLNYKFQLHPLFLLGGYLLLITAPLVYILGQTVPITMNLTQQRDSVGAVGGQVLHISTLGSFLGAVLTSLILMNFLGVAWTIVINCFFLVILVMILKPFRVFEMVFLGCLLLVIYHLNINFEKQNLIHTNHYANYTIHEPFMLQDGTQGKILDINLSASSFIGENNKGFEYIETLKHIINEELLLESSDILVLGAGGFTLSTDPRTNHYTYVDIDPAIQKVVEQHFLKKVHGDFIAKDARAYLRETDRQFDLIFSDAYSSALSVPSHLMTQEYFKQVKQRLKPNGHAVFNIIASPFLNDSYGQRVDNTIHSAFPHCVSIPLIYNANRTNILYLCHNTTKLDQFVYRDNKNPVTWDHFQQKKALAKNGKKE